jgi:multidrug efflux system membrane fusion protein
LLLAGCDKAAPAKDKDSSAAATNEIVLSAAEVSQADIRTAPIPAAQYLPQVRGYGTVVSFESLAQAVSDVTTAQAAVRQSAASLARARSLATGEEAAISHEVLDTAQRQAETDQSQLTLAERKEAVTFGRTAPWIVKGSRDLIMARLASGRLLLVRASFPLGAVPATMLRSLIVEPISGSATGRSWKTDTVWAAPTDPTIPGHGVFALVEGSDLTEGDRVVVSMPVGAPTPGVLVPADAAILDGNNVWCYTEEKPGTFVRRALDISRPMAGGYFATQGFRPGQRVVTQGASFIVTHANTPPSDTD